MWDAEAHIDMAEPSDQVIAVCHDLAVPVCQAQYWLHVKSLWAVQL